MSRTKVFPAPVGVDAMLIPIMPVDNAPHSETHLDLAAADENGHVASDMGAAGVVQRDEPASADAPPPATSGSRQSWVAHFEGLPEAERTLAYAFRSFPQPGTRSSLLASFGTCMLLNLSVGAPYAAHERTEGSPALQTAMRGLVGVLLGLPHHRPNLPRQCTDDRQGRVSPALPAFGAHSSGRGRGCGVHPHG